MMRLVAAIALFIAFAAAVAATLSGPTIVQGAEITYLDQQAIDRSERFPNLPPVSTWHHAGYWCEPEQNPPAGWLRPNGFCQLARQTARGSLMFLGDDPVFGWDQD